MTFLCMSIALRSKLVAHPSFMAISVEKDCLDLEILPPWKTDITLLFSIQHYVNQRAKKVVSSSPGLVDFAIGLVIFVLNLPNGQVLFFGEIQITEGL